MQTAYATYITGTPTEMIVLKGETDKGREIEIVITKTDAVRLLTEGAEAYRQCGHVGHALWHVDNNNTDFDNCWTCQQCKKEMHT